MARKLSKSALAVHAEIEALKAAQKAIYAAMHAAMAAAIDADEMCSSATLDAIEAHYRLQLDAALLTLTLTR